MGEENLEGMRQKTGWALCSPCSVRCLPEGMAWG